MGPGVDGRVSGQPASREPVPGHLRPGRGEPQPRDQGFEVFRRVAIVPRRDLDPLQTERIGPLPEGVAGVIGAPRNVTQELAGRLGEPDAPDAAVGRTAQHDVRARAKRLLGLEQVLDGKIRAVGSDHEQRDEIVGLGVVEGGVQALAEIAGRLIDFAPSFLVSGEAQGPPQTRIHVGFGAPAVDVRADVARRRTKCEVQRVLDEGAVERGGSGLAQGGNQSGLGATGNGFTDEQSEAWVQGISARRGGAYMTAPAWYCKRVDALRRIDEVTRERLFAVGQRVPLVRRAQVPNHVPADATVLWIVSGRIRLSSFAEDGAETALAILELGACFGPADRVDGRPSGTAEALEDSEVIAFTPAAIAGDERVARLFEAAGIRP